MLCSIRQSEDQQETRTSLVATFSLHFRAATKVCLFQTDTAADAPAHSTGNSSYRYLFAAATSESCRCMLDLDSTLESQVTGHTWTLVEIEHAAMLYFRGTLYPDKYVMHEQILVPYDHALRPRIYTRRCLRGSRARCQQRPRQISRVAHGRGWLYLSVSPTEAVGNRFRTSDGHASSRLYQQ